MTSTLLQGSARWETSLKVPSFPRVGVLHVLGQQPSLGLVAHFISTPEVNTHATGAMSKKSPTPTCEIAVPEKAGQGSRSSCTCHVLLTADRILQPVGAQNGWLCFAEVHVILLLYFMYLLQAALSAAACLCLKNCSYNGVLRTGFRSKFLQILQPVSDASSEPSGTSRSRRQR